jgi:hypothetical protein
MKKPIVLWIIAFLITAASAVYQRVTGPTYPLTENVTLNGAALRIRLERSHTTGDNFTVEVPSTDERVSGSVLWKRHGTDDAWKEAPLVRSGAVLRADLPDQPPAGKLDYRISLRDGNASAMVPSGGPATVRFKGDIPLFILILHVVVIFSAMLTSTRTAFESLSPAPQYRRYTIITLALLFFGGLVLGPIVQKFAFDAYWTGWPFGHDLTDNKTAVAFLAWLAAFRYQSRSAHPARWIIAAAAVTLLVFVIPHSVLGSELDYSEVKAGG